MQAAVMTFFSLCMLANSVRSLARERLRGEVQVFCFCFPLMFYLNDFFMH